MNRVSVISVASLALGATLVLGSLNGSQAVSGHPVTSQRHPSVSATAAKVTPSHNSKVLHHDAWKVYKAMWTDGCGNDFRYTWEGLMTLKFAKKAVSNGRGDYIRSEAFPGYYQVFSNNQKKVPCPNHK